MKTGSAGIVCIRGAYVAQVSVAGERLLVGVFRSLEEAEIRRDEFLRLRRPGARTCWLEDHPMWNWEAYSRRVRDISEFDMD